jgi:hypothetical protein
VPSFNVSVRVVAASRTHIEQTVVAVSEAKSRLQESQALLARAWELLGRAGDPLQFVEREGAPPQTKAGRWARKSVGRRSRIRASRKRAALVLPVSMRR